VGDNGATLFLAYCLLCAVAINNRNLRTPKKAEATCLYVSVDWRRVYMKRQLKFRAVI